MTTILILLAGILVTALLAYAIVKYIPLKMHWLVSVVLILLAVFLVYKINFEIEKPIKFNKEKVVKFGAVIQKLKVLRDAEVAFKKVKGKYTASEDTLIAFIENGKFPLTQTRYVPKTVKVGGGLTKEIEERVVDTIGYEPVLKMFDGRDFKNMFQMPDSDQKFVVKVGTIEKVEGLKAPVFEVRVDKAVILKGMDENLIKQEKESIGGEDIKGPDITIGSLADVSEDGNWPPSYDKGDKKNSEK